MTISMEDFAQDDNLRGRRWLRMTISAKDVGSERALSQRNNGR
jgi:hypothetical protein